MKEGIDLKGDLEITLVGPDGSTKFTKYIRNLIVTVGKDLVATSLNTGTISPFTHMAIGSGTTGAVIADTTLETEVIRVATSNSVVANAFIMQGVFGPGDGTGSVAEAGIFSAAVAGNMFSRTVFTAFTKNAADALTITWTITIG